MPSNGLWNPGDGLEPEDARIEAGLRVYRWRGSVDFDAVPARRLARRPRVRLAWACAAALVLALAAASWLRFEASERADVRARVYPFDVLSGSPQLAGGASTAGVPRELRVGMQLLCDAETRVRVSVAGIGSLLLEPGAQLAVGDPADGVGAEHLLRLEVGALEARIVAPPRVFQLATPAGIAVDLGCAYRASVEPDGSTRLSVTGGRVVFEAIGRKVTVPAGAAIVARTGGVPSTPVWSTARPEYVAAVRTLDELRVKGARASEAALAVVLADVSLEGTLALWHLFLASPSAPERERLLDALLAASPPEAPGEASNEGSESDLAPGDGPAATWRAACLRGEPEALQRLRRRFDWSW